MDTISLPFGYLPLVLELYSIPFNTIYDKERADDDDWYDEVANYNTDDFSFDKFDSQDSFCVQKIEAAIVTHNT